MALSNYGDKDFSLRSFAQSMGLSSELLSKPVAGIAYTRSGFNNCHHHFPELLEAVKRGYWPLVPCRLSFRPFLSAKAFCCRPLPLRRFRATLILEGCAGTSS